MSTRANDGEVRAPSAAARRFHYGFKVGVIALAMTATAVFSVLLVSRAGVRFDVTATREHRLSPRTTALLGSLDRDYDIVIAAPRRGSDQRAWQRLSDVLDSMTRASSHVRVTVIDTGSSDGTQKFAKLLDDLAARAKPSVDAAVSQVNAAADRAAGAGDAISRLAGAMIGAGDAAGVSAALRESFVRAAGGVSATGAELTKAAEQARTTLAARDSALPVPATDLAGAVLRRSLEQSAAALSPLITDFRALAADPNTPEALRPELTALQEQAGLARDAAARAGAALASVKHPAVLAVARSIERSAAALVIAEPSPDAKPDAKAGADERFITSVPIDRLLPPRRPEGAAGPAPDTRFLAEELLGAGIDSLQTRARPIVVFLHADPVSLAPEFNVMRGLVERLALAGVDCADWSIARSSEPPLLTELNPDGSRPVVYVTLSTQAETPDGATRMAKLADAISRLVERGERLLISVAPSPLKAMGAPDPMVSFLEPLGVVADSGRPLLREFAGPRKRAVTDELIVMDPGSDQPAARSMRGLATAFIWPIPLTLDGAKAEAARATLAPLVVIPADPALWAESQWQEYRRVPRDQRERVPNPPAKDSPADLVGGPWTVAAAIERAMPDGGAGGRGAKQRIVVIGSHGWFFDAIAMASAGMVDGRLAPAAPGNVELFSASVLWLCGLEDRIASGPVTGALATIPPMDPGTFSLIRWALIAGVPVGVLVLGAAWRLVRG